jgi:hypothetical protein
VQILSEAGPAKEGLAECAFDDIVVPIHLTTLTSVGSASRLLKFAFFGVVRGFQRELDGVCVVSLKASGKA